MIYQEFNQEIITSLKRAPRKIMKKKVLYLALIAMSTTIVPANSATDGIGDLSIYVPPKDGGNIMMMVDISGSMGTVLLSNGKVFVDSIYSDYKYSCITQPPYYGASNPNYVTNNGFSEASLSKTVTVDGSTIGYDLSGCKRGAWKNARYTNASWVASGYDTDQVFREAQPDRLGRLKDALIQSLGQNPDGSYRIESKNLVGLGQFSGNDNINNTSDVKRWQGKILVPASELTVEHRKRLINAIKGLNLGNNTPSANAYAEAAAYMMGTTTYKNNSTPHSGVKASDNSTTNSTRTGYLEPIPANNAVCYGKGVFFLTDGEPNSAFYPQTPDMMNLSLNSSNAVSTNCSLNGLITNSNTASGSDSGWQCIGQYAKALRNYTDRTKDIRTATVGLGSVFEGSGKLAEKTILNSSGKAETTIDCSKISNSFQDAKNLCYWGMKENYKADGTISNSDKMYGGGGFTVAKSAEDIQNSLQKFIRSFGDGIKPLPSGTITVPDDPYQSNARLPFAYLPMLQPSTVGGNQIWQGNLKRYKTQNGTLVGRSATGDSKIPLFLNSNNKLNPKVDFNPAAIDLWSDSVLEGGNNEITSGGFYAQLKAPNSTSAASVRNVWVESYRDSKDNWVDSSGVIKVGVDGNTNKPTLEFAKLGPTFENHPDFPSNSYGQFQTRRILLNFLGYNIDYNSTETIGVVNFDMTKYLPTDERRVVGGIIHSKPTLVSYGANVATDGTVNVEGREDYLLFGSMDGALHLVDAESGEEKWALVLQEMFRTQPTALAYESKGSLKFGIDAPWLVNARYDYGDVEKEGVTTQRVKLFKKSTGKDAADSVTENYLPIAAYGGFRMGGDGLYALDLENKEKPKVLFKITADPIKNTARVAADNIVKLHTNTGTNLKTGNATDYANVGQIWNQVTIGRLNKEVSDTKKPYDVIIFGGGYDMAYEDPTFIPTKAAKGSSVYIADAETGEQLWKWDNPQNHSIVGGITKLDRDNDGLFDHLYFADLGGNVFRADFTNKKGKKFANIRVVRILDSAGSLPMTDKKLAYRFYNRPVVSFYKDEGGNLFALVNIASGDRSSPLVKQRSLGYANRVYGIIDTDVTKDSIMSKPATGSDTAVTVLDTQESQLVKLGSLPTTTTVDVKVPISQYCGSTPSNLCKQKYNLISPMLSSAPVGTKKKGWYYPLTRFAGFEGINDVKAMGDYKVTNSFLYLSAFDPNLLYPVANTCDAQTVGGSEQQLYCLPYGVCLDDSSKTGSGGFSPVGQGIQELAFAPVDENNRTSLTVLGSRSLTDRLTITNRVDFGESTKKGTNPGSVSDPNKQRYPNLTKLGGDGSMAEMIFKERFILQPTQWFEAQ